MILETDFLDHWKTQMLSDLLGDEMAAVYVLRLWFHCQTRKAFYFERMSGPVMKAVCRFPGDGEKLKQSLCEAGFIAIDGEDVILPKFAETNAKMVSNWENGKRGGRHIKNPTETQTTENEDLGKPVGMVGRLVGKVGIEGLVGRSDEEPNQPTVSPVGVPEQTADQSKRAAIQAAEAYQARRYKTPDPKAKYYPALIGEAEKLFSGKNVDKRLSAFLAVCRAEPTQQLPADSTFSDIAIACGLKFSKATIRGGTVAAKPTDDRLLLAAKKRLAQYRSEGRSDKDFLDYGLEIPREIKLQAIEQAAT